MKQSNPRRISVHPQIMGTLIATLLLLVLGVSTTTGPAAAQEHARTNDHLEPGAKPGSDALAYLIGLCSCSKLLNMPESPAHRGEAYLGQWVYRIVLDFGASEQLSDHPAATVDHGR
jgi:hypothetical protein